MNNYLPKTAFSIAVAVSVLLCGQLATAGNLPTWGGGTTSDQIQIQEPSKPLVSEPATAPIQTVQPSQPGTWTAPSNITGPTLSTPTQQQSTQPSSTEPVVKPRAPGAELEAPTWQRNQPTLTVPMTRVPVGQGTTGSTSQQTRSDPAPAPAPRKGNYRVTINGFRIFAVKGVLPRRGHTYYAAAKVMRYSQTGSLLSQMTRSTRPIGHTNKFPGAIRGGSATKNGGFRNGDVYPASPAYHSVGLPSTDRLPLVVWEGELQEGGDIVVIEPALWEKRNGESILRTWRANIPSDIGYLYPCFPRHMDLTRELYKVPVPGWTEQNPYPIDGLVSGTTSSAYPEPGIERLKESPRVCVEVTPQALFRPTGRDEPDVIAGLTEKTFYIDRGNNYESGKVNVSSPYGMLLNYSMAEKMANETRTEPVYAVDYWTNSFPSGFISKNKRMETYLSEGGIQVFMFSRIPVDKKTMNISGANSAMVIPDWAVIELYVQVRRV